MAKRISKKSPSAKAGSRPADAVQMLKADHKQVRERFAEFHSAQADNKDAIARRLFAELDIHTVLEEELFYPAVQTKLESLSTEASYRINGLDLEHERETVVEEPDGDRIDGMDLDAEDMEEALDDQAGELITNAYESHQSIKDLIQQLRSLDAKSPDFEELLSELEATVIEHVMEEEDMILPMAASQLDVHTLGAEMRRRRDDLESQSPLAA